MHKDKFKTFINLNNVYTKTSDFFEKIKGHPKELELKELYKDKKYILTAEIFDVLNEIT